jgi:hypothetical protein
MKKILFSTILFVSFLLPYAIAQDNVSEKRGYGITVKQPRNELSPFTAKLAMQIHIKRHIQMLYSGWGSLQWQ